MDYQDKARGLYEYHREAIDNTLEKAKSKLQNLSHEIDNAKLSDEEYEKLDGLLLDLMIILDSIWVKRFSTIIKGGG